MSTPYAEVIGDPVAQSKSPAIHRFWLEKLGIDADYRATQVSADQVAAPSLKIRNKRGCVM